MELMDDNLTRFLEQSQDFGMAKLFNINRAIVTPLTVCPGTLVYMSPEALDDPPVYTKKLDTSSFGILGIQIITRQFPDPGPSHEERP